MQMQMQEKKIERSEKVDTSIKRKTKWKFPHICSSVGQTEGIPTCTSCDIWMYVTVSPIREIASLKFEFLSLEIS